MWTKTGQNVDYQKDSLWTIGRQFVESNQDKTWIIKDILWIYTRQFVDHSGQNVD